MSIILIMILILTIILILIIIVLIIILLNMSIILKRLTSEDPFLNIAAKYALPIYPRRRTQSPLRKG